MRSVAYCPNRQFPIVTHQRATIPFLRMRLLALVAAATLASARLATENVTLTFSPAFFKGKPLSLMPALYGSARYGDVVTGRVVYSVPKNRQGCHEIDAESEPQWPVGEDIIVMLDRGDCAFEQKT